MIFHYRSILVTAALLLTGCADKVETNQSVPAKFITLEELSAGDNAAGRDSEGRPFSYALLGEGVPEFSALMTNGETFSRDNLQGQWSLVQFWGMWCSDCLADVPYANALRLALAQDPNTQFVGIHTPPSFERREEAFGKWGSLEAFFSDKGGAYDVVVDADSSIRDMFKVEWTPTFLLVAPDLTIHAFRTDLSIDVDEGIKPVIQQISQLQAAYPSDE